LTASTGRYMEYPTEPCWESDMLDSNRRLLIRKAISSVLL